MLTTLHAKDGISYRRCPGCMHVPYVKLQISPAVVDLPTPPFAEATATMCSTCVKPNFLAPDTLDLATVLKIRTSSFMDLFFHECEPIA